MTKRFMYTIETEPKIYTSMLTASSEEEAITLLSEQYYDEKVVNYDLVEQKLETHIFHVYLEGEPEARKVYVEAATLAEALHKVAYDYPDMKDIFHPGVKRSE